MGVQRSWWRVAATVVMVVAAGRAAFGQELTVGGVQHVVSRWATYDALPASLAQGAMRGAVRDKAARPGTRWYVVTGSTTNRTARQAIFGYGTVWVSADGVEVTPSSASAFQPAGTSVSRSVRLASGEKADWVAFFQVPTGARDVQLTLTNLDANRRTRLVGTMPLTGRGGSAPPPSAAAGAAPRPAVNASAPPAPAVHTTGLTRFATKVRNGQLTLQAPPGAVASRTAGGAMAISAPGFRMELHPGLGMLSRKKDDVRANAGEKFVRFVTDAPPTGMIYETQAAGRPNFHVYYVLKGVGGGLVCADAQGATHSEPQARMLYAACGTVALEP